MHDEPDFEERSLISRCLAGERQAWEEFFKAYYRTISSIVSWKKWGFEQAEKEDVTQDILEAVIKSLAKFEFKSRVNTFVYRISVSTCIAHLRKRMALKRGSDSPHVSLDTVASEGDYAESEVHGHEARSPEELLLRHEEAARVKEALSQVGDRCGELIRMRYYEELSFQEISQITATRENTLVVQLKRCLLRLNDFLRAAG